MENVAEPIVEVSKVFNLSMEHDTANHTWTQKIDPFTVFVDLKNKVIKTFKNGKEIELLSFKDHSFSLLDYENLLMTVEQNANELKQFSNES